MTITSYEIAQQTGLTHTEVEHIITRFDARRIAAGGRPLEQREGTAQRPSDDGQRAHRCRYALPLRLHP